MKAQARHILVKTAEEAEQLKQRIAKGCGRDMNEVNQFFKQFEQMKQMMKMMNKVQDGKMKMPNMGNMFKR